MILVSIICLSAIVWLFSVLDKKRSQHAIFSYILMFAIFLGLLLIPVFRGHSVINVIYSFFDIPSYLSIIWSLLFIGKVCIGDFFKIESVNRVKIRSTSIVLLFVVGLIYFISSSGILWFNIYYFSVLNQAIIVAVFSFFIFLTDKMFFLMITLSLVPFAFFNSANLTIFDFIIDPYLWLFCGAKTVSLGVRLFINSYIKRFLGNRTTQYSDVH